jgi:UDP-N-acetylglucosamine--N-acetylmuramyl-(pentapeptide) pyrophosphoryl-undecaprenol N-acetylglucosamine transferase
MIARRGLALVKVAERNGGPAATAVRAPAALFRARRLLASFGPDVVVGLGGGASLGAALAAITMRRPLVLLEQNAIAGRANRRLARWAAQVCCQWNCAVQAFNGRGAFTGSPVRTEIARARALDKGQARAVFGLSPDLPTLLVMGGSQGARSINRAMVAAAPRLAGRVQVIHLAGEQDKPALSGAYKAVGLAAHVTSFLEAMQVAYAAADLALSRAGATSIAELAAVGLPAILVPYPYAKDDHQRANAREAIKQGWAVRLEQGEMDPERTAELITTTLAYGARLEAMRRKALASARDDAADRIFETLVALSARGRKVMFETEQNVGG